MAYQNAGKRTIYFEKGRFYPFLHLSFSVRPGTKKRVPSHVPTG